ncbi:hypothetical protein SK32_02273 [Citrobacter sp. MGH100]|nr:hypothetical protein SK32_02273 [Citrobacter sp. MGH100]
MNMMISYQELVRTFPNYGMSIEGYNLIRGLPCKLTLGFKIEAVLWILCIPVLLSMFIAF